MKKALVLTMVVLVALLAVPAMTAFAGPFIGEKVVWTGGDYSLATVIGLQDRSTAISWFGELNVWAFDNTEPGTWVGEGLLTLGGGLPLPISGVDLRIPIAAGWPVLWGFGGDHDSFLSFGFIGINVGVELFWPKYGHSIKAELFYGGEPWVAIGVKVDFAGIYDMFRDLAVVAPVTGSP